MESATPKAQRPLIIGHRGACGSRPDHTLASYDLAIDQGADYAEPDLVISEDGVLLCRHEVELGVSTDVAQKYPDRKRTVTIDGQELTGWFAHDFTLAEIKTLRARQPLAFRDHQYDGQYEVPTFVEFLNLISQRNKQLGRQVGIIPEIKHSTYHAALGLPLENRLLDLLSQYGYTDRHDPCMLQSFETANLKQLATRTNLRLLQLIDGPHKQPADVVAAKGTLTYGQMMQPDGLADIARYAWGVGPWKESILPRDQQNRLLPPTRWITDAHQAGLKVIVYTLRSEPQYLAADYQGNPEAEYLRWFDLGVEGMFTDFPDAGISAWQRYESAIQHSSVKSES